MMKAPSRIVAVDFVERLCFPDLQSVGRKVAALIKRLLEVETKMTTDQQRGDAAPKGEKSRPSFLSGNPVCRRRIRLLDHASFGYTVYRFNVNSKRGESRAPNCL